MQLPPCSFHHPALPQRAPSLGTYVRCSDGQRQSLLPAKRRSLDLNCLLAASNVPLLPSALRQTGNGRVGLTWFDKKACVMQRAVCPLFLCLPPSDPFFNQILSFLFPMENTIRAPFYIRLLPQTSKLLSSPLCFSL